MPPRGRRQLPNTAMMTYRPTFPCAATLEQAACSSYAHERDKVSDARQMFSIGTAKRIYWPPCFPSFAIVVSIEYGGNGMSYFASVAAKFIDIAANASRDDDILPPPRYGYLHVAAHHFMTLQLMIRRVKGRRPVRKASMPKCQCRRRLNRQKWCRRFNFSRDVISQLKDMRASCAAEVLRRRAMSSIYDDAGILLIFFFHY